MPKYTEINAKIYGNDAMIENSSTILKKKVFLQPFPLNATTFN